ncbi:MAG: DUF928 domain-containing protein [Cyanomargarita calcarea GSE-NOS-MK-12-04C]|jgi:hypothetical protein|uniref:DUF928 domain-containing protein n=1 Tax=Cyanomargarita calcarea GSE-NOS-MK-12-04C TaxID=2839659 RepID=A0A951USJ1_9CYAN|nr:DUF928 domain-containing protein [Cyanomargarita calcarea GSE-NOS-MK-12-04C]
MSINKLSSRILSALLIGIVNYPILVQASQTIIPKNQLIAEVPFPNNGAPKGRRRGGTSRNRCPDLKMPITALVPGEKDNDSSNLGFVVAEYPQFWVYIPSLPQGLQNGEFVLQDEQGNDLWRKLIPLPGKPGAIALQLPQNLKYALQLKKKYHWYFKVYCGEPRNQPEYIYVDAWVERIALTPDLQRQLSRSKSQEYNVYIANQLWYDALAYLARLRQINPRDSTLALYWTKLLNGLDLEELANTPIVQIYEN